MSNTRSVTSKEPALHDSRNPGSSNGVSPGGCHDTCFRPGGSRPRTRKGLASPVPPPGVATWATKQPLRRWRRVPWRNGQNRPWEATSIAVRVTPDVVWRRGEPVHDLWLLCQPPVGPIAPSQHDRCYLSNLPPETSVRALVRATHQR